MKCNFSQIIDFGAKLDSSVRTAASVYTTIGASSYGVLHEGHIMDRRIPRAFDGKVESMMVDSQDGANQIQHRHWDKGASDEWGSPIPTICANVWLRQSRPVIPVRKLLSCSTWLCVLLGDSSSVSAKQAVSVQTNSAGTRLFRLSHIQISLRNL